MADVGAAAGVSDATVSNVLSGKVKVTEKTRSAVLAAVEDLGYRMNASARGLRTGRTGSISLAIPDLSSAFYARVAQAIVREAEGLDWSVTLHETGFQQEKELDIFLGRRRQLTDGLIFYNKTLHSDGSISTPDQPVVVLGEALFTDHLSNVAISNVEGAHAATQHLAQSGRRRIAALGTHPEGGVGTVRDRLAGYRQALAEADLPIDPNLVLPSAWWGLADGAALAEELMTRRLSVDALFCFNDTLALGAMHVLSRHGVRIPDDIAVIGFDNIDAAAFGLPPLTSIDPGVEELAAVSVAALANFVDGNPGHGHGVRRIPFRLVQRESA